MIKQVKYLLPAELIDMGGFPVKQALPTQQVQQVDPFLLLHHARVGFKKDGLAKHQGVGPHPHRGFSPVTFVVEGELHHQDSRGNSQIAKKGEVQWMNAGMGVIHSERPTQALVESGQKQEIIQLWINTPADKKMEVPEYNYLSSEDMVIFPSEDKQISNKLIAGRYENLEGKIIPKSNLIIVWGIANGAGEQRLATTPDWNTMIYVIKGKISIKQYGNVEKEHLIVFDNTGDNIQFSVEKGTQFIFLSGNPINEKVAQQGPFVMNSQTEILEAMRDYQMGKMGFLVEK